MDSFYIITNILKDKDYAVTDKICNYIEQKGKKWTLAKKDEEGHILPGTVPSDVECGTGTRRRRNADPCNPGSGR